jgi:hypothetical protein
MKKIDLIRQLLEVIGTREKARDIVLQTMEQVASPEAKGSAGWDEFKRRVLARINPDDMTGLIIPVYGHHLSYGDIEELIRFYRTPIGQRFLKVLPALTEGLVAAGMEYGHQVGNAVIEEMEKEHLKFA